MASDLSLLTCFPEIRRAVASDRSGAVLDSVGESDAESLAAVTGSIAELLTQAGENLGLGDLRWASVEGETQASILAVHEDAVVAGRVETPRSLAAIQKALDDALLRKV
jgi:predicted regulator of Ras-like GTPase activity (Roadblock/LC7/MglB family)